MGNFFRSSNTKYTLESIIIVRQSPLTFAGIVKNSLIVFATHDGSSKQLSNARYIAVEEGIKSYLFRGDNRHIFAVTTNGFIICIDPQDLTYRKVADLNPEIVMCSFVYETHFLALNCEESEHYESLMRKIQRVPELQYMVTISINREKFIFDEVEDWLNESLSIGAPFSILRIQEETTQSIRHQILLEYKDSNHRVMLHEGRGPALTQDFEEVIFRFIGVLRICWFGGCLLYTSPSPRDQA
eukprot:TRINITY_DN20136_c0_g1_i2.p1 TRINITY_DN20136_c0_g1~~TRINITY_DN20136_c0_g1_i2.p1  ORF type:complete len:242 (-),score=15.28 TRINITY_DN20136_c0_g1_i2:92-817(-)